MRRSLRRQRRAPAGRGGRDPPPFSGPCPALLALCRRALPLCRSPAAVKCPASSSTALSGNGGRRHHGRRGGFCAAVVAVVSWSCVIDAQVCARVSALYSSAEVRARGHQAAAAPPRGLVCAALRCAALRCAATTCATRCARALRACLRARPRSSRSVPPPEPLCQ